MFQCVLLAYLLCYSGMKCPLKGDGGLGSWSEGWQAVVEVVTEQQHEYRIGGADVTRWEGRKGDRCVCVCLWGGG